MDLHRIRGHYQTIAFIIRTVYIGNGTQAWVERLNVFTRKRNGFKKGLPYQGPVRWENLPKNLKGIEDFDFFQWENHWFLFERIPRKWVYLIWFDLMLDNNLNWLMIRIIGFLHSSSFIRNFETSNILSGNNNIRLFIMPVLILPACMGWHNPSWGSNILFLFLFLMTNPWIAGSKWSFLISRI